MTNCFCTPKEDTASCGMRKLSIIKLREEHDSISKENVDLIIPQWEKQE